MASEDSITAVVSYLEARREQIQDFACHLIATPSANPPGNERMVSEVILRKMDELGLAGTQVVARSPERPNLIYRQQGNRGSPSLILNAHMDTKPVGEEDRKLWQTDPLKPTVRDGKIFGLGSGDDKGSIAAIVYAAAALNTLHDRPGGDLLVILTANEEAAGEFGANWLVKNERIQADFCLVAEPSGIQKEFESLPIWLRNAVLFKIKVYGTQMHSSLSDQIPSVNASVKMAWVLWRMARDLKLSYSSSPYYPKGPTINLGDYVRAGVDYGIYPGYAEFGSDLRIIPGMTIQGVKRDLEEFLTGLRQEDAELRVEFEIEDEEEEEQAWKWLAGDEPFVRILQSASAQVLGRDLALRGYPAFTDGYWFHSYAGIPTIPAFGPGLLSLAHRPNEYVTIEGIIQASKIYALAALQYLH